VAMPRRMARGGMQEQMFCTYLTDTGVTGFDGTGQLCPREHIPAVL
jgi:hypothetical protein